jgi:hypothetical protein
MTLRHRIPKPLAEIIRSQQEEIKKYKWIESEKAGQDIGWERACREWLQKYFPDWKQHAWHNTVRDAVRKQSLLAKRAGRPGPRKATGSRSRGTRIAGNGKTM